MIKLNSLDEKTFLAILYIEDINEKTLLANQLNIINFLKGNDKSVFYPFFKRYDDVCGRIPKVNKDDLSMTISHLKEDLLISEIDGVYHVVDHSYTFFGRITSKQQTLALKIIQLIDRAGIDIKRTVSLNSIYYKTKENDLRWYTIGFDVDGNYVVWARKLQKNFFPIKSFFLDDEHINEILEFINEGINYYKRTKSTNDPTTDNYLISDNDIAALL